MDKKRLYAEMVSVISCCVRAIMGGSKFRRFIHAE